MERFALAGLLVVTLPSVGVAAQRVEIGMLVGWYQQTPSTISGRCAPGPCSWQYVRGGGATLGGRFSLLGPRYGISVSVLQARTMTSGTFVDPDSVTHQIPMSELRSTFFALQPQARFPISKMLEANVAAGPSWTNTDAQIADTWLGVALSGALRAQLAPHLALDLRGSNMYRLGSDQDGNRNHWITAVGLAWAVKR